MIDFRLLLITDRRALPMGRSLADQLRPALDGVPPGSVALLLRDKDLSAAERARLFEPLLPIAARAGAPLLVHGDAGLASRLGAGLHLPEAAALPGAGWRGPLGRSCHDVKGLQRATVQGCDYALLSPVRASPNKGAPLGWSRFAELIRATDLPIYALGGLGPEDATTAALHGAAGCAVIRSVLGARRPGEVVRRFLGA